MREDDVSWCYFGKLLSGGNKIGENANLQNYPLNGRNGLFCTTYVRCKKFKEVYFLSNSNVKSLKIIKNCAEPSFNLTNAVFFPSWCHFCTLLFAEKVKVRTLISKPVFL